MYEFIRLLFDSENFMPHGQCLLWAPEVLWLHVISDIVITLSYFSIPCIIFYITIKNRSRIDFHWIYVMFGSFILLCGFSHLLAVWTLWNPIYRFEGLIKAITAGVSIATAFLLIPLIPMILETLEKNQDNSENGDK